MWKKLLVFLFGPACEKCGFHSVRRGYFASGWNSLCQQASCDPGTICGNCLHIKFDKSFEERKAIAAEHTPWVTVKI